MKAIFINESKVKFIDLMLNQEKLFETRNKDMLKGLFEPNNIYEFVALVSTGNGKPIVKGYAFIRKGFPVSEPELNQIDSALYIKNTPYQCKPGKSKVLYSIESPVKCKPYQIPNNAIYHGRSWCEW